MFDHPDEHSLVEAGTTACSKASVINVDVAIKASSATADAATAAAPTATPAVVQTATVTPCQHSAFDSEGDNDMLSNDDDHGATAACTATAMNESASSDEEDDTVMDEAAMQAQIELIELKRIGEKVVLPEPKRRKAHASAPAAIVATIEAAFDWAPYSNEQLEDWLDLEELGGTAPWPNGATRKAAAAELCRRVALGKFLASQDAPT
jgi:hypothetical protein